MAASGAPIQVATEGCRTANRDGVQYAQMEPRQPGSVLCDEVIAVLSDDVGHLEGWLAHLFCSFRERLLFSGLEVLNRIQWVGPGAQMLLRKLQVQGGVFELGMPQQ